MARQIIGTLLLGAALALSGCASVTGGSPSAASSSAHSAPTAATTPRSAATSSRPPSTPRPSPRRTAIAEPVPRSGPPAVVPPRASTSALPLDLPTGDATEVITAVAASTGSTSGTLQAWRRTSGGWQRHGLAVTAHFGSAGLTYHPSESLSATPIGSYRLSEAFGSRPNPGTRLPYFQTGPADWWISQAGPLYNTHQRCSTNCPFAQGDPNEHLYYEQPYYRYAVVIDVNASDSGHSTPGGGSAFFLHVTDGGPTAGCVSIDESTLASLMQWLTPSANPRILIGTG